MTTNQQLKAARLELLRSSATIATLIQELEAELQRMRERKLGSELLDKKDAQIEALVSYYNQVTELTAFYQTLCVNQQVELHNLVQLIAQISKNSTEAHQAVRQYLKKG